MPRRGGRLKEAGTGGNTAPHAREPLPLSEAVLWVPTAVSEPTEKIWPHPDSHAVFLQHDVLAGISRHLGRDETEARFGFLLGHLFRCPDSGRQYVVADTAVAAGEVLDEETSGAYLIKAWSEAQSVFSGHSGLLLGWYHSHWRSGPVPSEADVETAARYFAAPWQFSIVLVPDERKPRGGVFHHVPGEPPATPRAVPFYELFGAPHEGGLDGLDFAVPWSDHEPIVPTEPPAVEAPPAEPKKTPAEPKKTPAEPKKTPAERTKAAAPRMTPWPEENATVPDPPGESTPVKSPSTEGAAEERPPEAARPVERSPAAGRSAPDAARPRTVAHPSPGGHGDRPAAIPLVIPGDGDETGLLPPRTRRPGWPAIVGAVCLIVIALFFLFTGDSDGPTTTPVSPTMRAQPSAAVQTLLDRVEAVEIARERYAERAEDFDAGRIGCDLLTTGYVAADEAYIRAAGAYRELGEDADARATDAYETAGEEIAAVNSHFDQSGCPRP